MVAEVRAEKRVNEWDVRSEALPLGDLLVRSANRWPDVPALVFPTEQYTYRELLDHAIDVSRGLIALGVKRGDNVGILAPNSLEFAAGLFGAALAGAVIVPLHVRSTSRELAFLVTHARLKVVLTTDRIAPRVDFEERLRGALAGLRESDGDSPLRLDSAPDLAHIVMLRGQGSAGTLGQQSFARLSGAATSEDVDRARSRVRVRDAAVILYTSGTTSNPKGCLTSHEAITRGSMGRIGAAFAFEDVPERLVMWNPAPLFHIAALQAFVFALGTGATFLTDTHLDANRALESIRTWRANSLWSMFMPPMRTLRTADGFDPAELDWVHSVWAVGPQVEMQEIVDMFPQAALVAGSGMSETAGWYCLTARSDSAQERVMTVGKPVAGAELRVVDPETGIEKPRGERGELLVRTYTLMDGYFHDPERTAEAIDEDGWMHTGDAFTHLASGHFVFDGRIKDMLKVGGENVPAVEIEGFLCAHADIVTAEVVGIPDPHLDEVPVAFVELAKGAVLDEQQILEFCAGELATFKTPRAVHFVEADEWPMSASKVNKRVLRERAAQLAQGGARV